MGLIHKEEKHEVKHTSFLSLLGTVFNNISHYFSTAPAKPTVKTLLDPKRAQNLGACATSTNCLSSEQFSFQLSIESYPGLPSFCFNSLCDWSRKLRHHRNQSNQELKSILIWSLAFSRASIRLPLFTLSSHRLMMMF